MCCHSSTDVDGISDLIFTHKLVIKCRMSTPAKLFCLEEELIMSNYEKIR